MKRKPEWDFSSSLHGLLPILDNTSNGHYCLLFSAHFLLDSSIRPVFALYDASAGFPLYYSLQTTATIPP